MNRNPFAGLDLSSIGEAMESFRRAVLTTWAPAVLDLERAIAQLERANSPAAVRARRLARRAHRRHVRAWMRAQR